jgi:hypothetical protein
VATTSLELAQPTRLAHAATAAMKARARRDKAFRAAGAPVAPSCSGMRPETVLNMYHLHIFAD